ncbi:hypothetical protein [Chryseobacterium polytrichastri]|uniref:Uncharacterized protein n=1 Tax=Chryseobacterium polytrichastri TaxID=1302687 RepID=A0A1M7ITP2_9FLAO|nr:hypothetical protein [Chryseobacterium polytrichastri]SHM44059.1 hypothetical protein SAMN05444267_104812 [Chryseobacterium polytrichastri]
MEILFNNLSTFFERQEKLWPPIITGCVTISIFLFTIWKDKIKDNRKKRSETRQKSTYLFNLLQDASNHINEQLGNNKIIITQLERSPTEFALLTYLPIDYLQRLSLVLANDSYFAAFNAEYNGIDEQKRIRLYNDLAIDIDLFYGYLTELYRYIERSATHYEKAKESYFINIKILLKNLADLHYKLDTDSTEDMDREELLGKLNKIDSEEMFKVLADKDMVQLKEQFITPIHGMLAGFLIPLFSYTTSVTSLCQDCQNVNEQYHGLLNANIGLKESIIELNKNMLQTLDSFKTKLGTLEITKR